MKKLLLILCCIIFFDGNAFAQNQHLIDSLQTRLKQLQSEKAELRNNKPSINDSSIAKTLGRLFVAHIYSAPEKALDYAQQSLAVSEQIAWKKGIGSAYNYIGGFYDDQGEYLKALENFSVSLKIKEEIGDKRGISNAYCNIGNVHYYQGNYPEALENYFAALKIVEEMGDKNGIALVYKNIGNIYNNQGNFPEALKNYSASFKIHEEMGNKQGIAHSYSGIGILYIHQGNYPEALKNFFAAFKINEEIGNKEGMANAYNDIGAVFYKQGKYPEALENYFASLKIYELMGRKKGLAGVYGNIGEVYTKLNRPKEAKIWLQKGLDLSREIGAKGNIKDTYSSLATTDSTFGNYKGAFENYKLYILYKDSLLNEENTKKTTQQQMQYEFDKKESLAKAEQEKKDAIALEEIEKQKVVRNGFVGGFTVMLLFAVVFFMQRNKIKQGNRELKIAKERAEHSEKMEQQFLANMSHEIRTPMNAVMGMTNLVLDTALNPKQKFYLEGIKKSSDNLLHIINDILDISKIEVGKMDLEKIDFSIHAVAKQVMQTLEHKAEEKGLELVLNIDSTINDIVLGDPVRLNQILINLAGNAIKFTEKGSVSIEVKNTEKGTKFSVSDTGIGIPKDKLQSVFESFSQANSSDTRKYGGTGLGLSISRQLIELMGGKIGLESVEGSGTTFFFALPFEAGSEERLKQRLAKEEQIDGSILDTLRILVVDDNEYNRIVAKDTLESKSKAEVVTASSAQEAIALLKQSKFDVVLMDVQMPLMNGFEATQYIRHNFEEPLKNIPIIALTASVLRTDLDKCMAAGMNSYVPKPFKTSQLIAGIAQVLNIAVKTESKKEIQSVKPDNTILVYTNLDYLRKFCEGNEAKMKKYINLFTSTAPELIRNINYALQKNELEEIANQIHGFKTKWIMMGMTETKKLAMEIEKQCREGKADESLSENISSLVHRIKISISELS